MKPVSGVTIAAAVAVAWLVLVGVTAAQETSNTEVPPGDPVSLMPPGSVAGAGANPAPSPASGQSPNAVGLLQQLPNLSSRENLSAALQIVILLTVLSLAPAILIMMTSFTRIVIVLSLLRQALGTQQLPPNQVLIGLALFMTCIVMWPTWSRVNNEAIQPYMNGQIDQRSALSRAQVPLRDFMIGQIVRSGNDQDVLLFTDFAGQQVRQWSDVGTMQLVPAFMLSELKTAFLMGFKVYLPFLIVDMVISSVLISMGMMMLPPVLISLPFKLLLFVLVDGWRLITGSLMGSFV
ncbi:flagellar type III secretion system pore protein FliP [Fontivita pretiosa]|uniref:flagellar type III secretion system pore protein FliP n=1 Tax=Fontivita pretiosa TaxID=2989684 RepID=UPI003D176290